MNFTIKPWGRMQWTITDTEIMIGNEIIPLEAITGIKHIPPIKFPGAQGTIFVDKEGPWSKNNLDDHVTLIYDKKDVNNIKEMTEFLFSLFNNEKYEKPKTKENGWFYITKKREYVNNSERPKQFYKKCNTCGHIYCYSQADLDKNNRLSRDAAANTFAAAFGPAIMSATYNKTANDSQSRIVDYDKCPKCNSVDVVLISEEDAENILKNQNTQQSNLSQADELKKFKDLLDSGVITQEEFDQKKKQLLGL